MSEEIVQEPLLIDELVRVGAFNSKGEARKMIQNKGVSVLRCICPVDEPKIFDDCGNDFTIDPNIPNARIWQGIIKNIDGTVIPATLLDQSLHEAMLCEKQGIAKIFETPFVLKWNKEEFGKNPFLINSVDIRAKLNPGDKISIGKNRSVTVTE